MEVERFRGWRNGVDNHQPGRHFIRSSQAPGYRVLEQRSTHAVSLHRTIDSETAKNHRRDLRGHVPAHASRYLLVQNLTHGQGIITNHAIFTRGARNITPARSIFEVDKGALA